MSPRSSDEAKDEVTPKGSVYEGDDSPRSITAACSFQLAPTPLDLPPAIPGNLIDFVAMCERKRHRSRELARDLEQLSWAGRAHSRTQLLALSVLLAAVMLLCFLPHPPTSTTPPIKPKAALLQPLMMHYEFDPDMFDNFWFPLFV